MTYFVERPYFQIDLSEECLSDILITGVEGGINYWAEGIRVIPSDKTYDVSGISLVSSISIDGGVEDEPWEDTKYVTYADVARGLQLYVDYFYPKEPKHAEDILDELAHWDDKGGCIFDALVADAVIQLAVFGEIVYG